MGGLTDRGRRVFGDLTDAGHRVFTAATPTEQLVAAIVYRR